jgi:hypothetical protein
VTVDAVSPHSLENQMKHRARLAAVLLVGLAGCASGGSGAPSNPPGTIQRRPNVISAAEIAEQSFRIFNGVQAVMILRPNWPKITVYLDNRLFGLFEKLQEIPANTIREIRLLSVQESRARFGPDAQPAILVLRKTG